MVYGIYMVAANLYGLVEEEEEAELLIVRKKIGLNSHLVEITPYKGRPLKTLPFRVYYI